MFWRLLCQRRAQRWCSFAHPGDPSGWRCKSMFVLCIIMLHPDGSPTWIFKTHLKFSPNEGESWWCIWTKMHLVQFKMINDKNDLLKSKYYFQTLNSNFLHIYFSAITKNAFSRKNWKTHFPAKTARCLFLQKNVKHTFPEKHIFWSNQ